MLIISQPHEASPAHAEHVPWIVQQVNHLVGPIAFSIEAQIMPPIYRLFGAHWPGEGQSYDQYLAAGQLPIPTHVVMFFLVVIFTVIVLTLLRRKLSVETPSNRQQGFEIGVEGIRNLLVEIVGPKGVKHFPVVATFGTLILFSNLMGLLPDMVAPTANLNVTLALALTSFIYYNYVGIKENGIIGYLKHFAGPVPSFLIMVVMFPIEIISNLARIMSLSLRLFGNMYGEEQVSGTISSLIPWIVPAFMTPLALMTSVIQTFIFMMLSMIYLGEVTHHDDDHAKEGKDSSHGDLAAAH